MFAALVLAGIVAAPIGTICLLIQPSRRRRVAGAWPTARRLLFAVAGTVLLAALAGLLVRLFGASEHNAIAGAAGLAVGSLVWLPVTRRWTARGHLCWSATIFLFVVYLAFVLDWTFSSDLGPAHGGRAAAVAVRGVRRPAGLRLPVGDLRRAGVRAVAAADYPRCRGGPGAGQ